MLMPLERSTRPASTVVRRSSQKRTGRPVRSASASGEFPHPFRLPAFGAAHVQGIAHQDQRDLALLGERASAARSVAYAGAHQVGKTLRGDAQGIAEGQADALLAEVECQDSAGGNGQVNFIINGPC